MSEHGQPTDDDRRRAAEALDRGLNPGEVNTASWDAIADAQVAAVAQALADERERERGEWNPIVGRVLALAQGWAATELNVYSDGPSVLRDAARQVFDAVRPPGQPEPHTITLPEAVDPGIVIRDPADEPPVELVVLGPGLVTWDGRTLNVTYAPGLTAEESAAGSARVKAMLAARGRS